ncbi:hypothetical protein NL108_014210 [Boleophthalmus pectinirostris]|uniref:C-type lectin domain family 4 member G-like n=1 Tax=Boleophthalmus pectinirostris TaxID=150288 RepID=UPI0024324F97|nr:C-type lectin domain family 4 member G-like [Boleophthalmus pectinirostris]KAJ0055313.1 hypothetical protein NL108_014210 [Boleophthalmus pectinirostris]
MSAPAGPKMYSKLITGEQGPRVSPSAAGRPQGRSAPSPGLSPGRGPGLYKASTMALAALCVIPLIFASGLPTHNQKNQTSEGETIPQTEKQEQEVNVTELLSIISKLKEENQQLRAELNSSKAVQTLSPPLQCPPTWLPFSGSCYYISGQALSWEGSQSFCESQGGHLAIIKSKKEQTFLWNLIPRTDRSEFWIGLIDEFPPDLWYWVDGTQLVGGFWVSTEPEPQYPDEWGPMTSLPIPTGVHDIMPNDCGFISKKLETRVATRSWYQAPCSTILDFICEKKVPGATAKSQN